MVKAAQNRLSRIYSQSKLKPPYTRWSLVRRFWIYQNERIPLAAMIIIAVTLALSVSRAAGYSGWSRVIAASAIIVLYFLQIRLSDEPKDFEHDNQYYPTRPIQRGLITLKELSSINWFVMAGFFVAAALTGSLPVILLAIFQQFYSFLTRKEFFIRDWLRKHFFIYQFSHYFQLLILDWLILSVLQVQPVSDKLLYFVFIFLLAAPIEASRTIGGSDKIEADDRYSYKLGVNGALMPFLLFTVASAASVIYLVHRLNGSTFWPILAVGLVIVGWAVYRYKQKPVTKRAEDLNAASLVMYLTVVVTLYFK